ncbi:DNA helicase [Tanacetum coccineum]
MLPSLNQVFAKWLLDVGNGEIREPNQEDNQHSSWITIPLEYCVSPGEKGMLELIDFIYDDTTLKTPTTGALQENAIMCLKNNIIDVVNAEILSDIEGQTNTITFLGFPPHELQLKVGSPIMLL